MDNFAPPHRLKPKLAVWRVNNVARMFGVAPRTIRNWAATGVLPAHKRGPRLWFFYERDLLPYLDMSLADRTNISGNNGISGRDGKLIDRNSRKLLHTPPLGDS